LNATLLGATNIVVSDLAVTESASALGRSVREGQLTRPAARDLHRRIIAFADRAIGVETVPAVRHEARRLLRASDQPLRTLDSLHLALALDAQARRPSSPTILVSVTPVLPKGLRSRRQP
jgi:hypothetical protein